MEVEKWAAVGRARRLGRARRGHRRRHLCRAPSAAALTRGAVQHRPVAIDNWPENILSARVALCSSDPSVFTTPRRPLGGTMDGGPDPTPYSSADPLAVERAGAALGPHRVQILAVEALSLRANRKYSSSTVHCPATVPPLQLLASIVIVPGWACSENTIAAWGSFFASQ